MQVCAAWYNLVEIGAGWSDWLIGAGRCRFAQTGTDWCRKKYIWFILVQTSAGGCMTVQFGADFLQVGVA